MFQYQEIVDSILFKVKDEVGENVFIKDIV